MHKRRIHQLLTGTKAASANGIARSAFLTAAFLAVGLLYPPPSAACECIVSGETKHATIEFGGETQCYWFWGEAGQGVVIQMGDLSDEADSDSLYGGLEPRVQLYDSNGVRIADSQGYSQAAVEDCRLTKTGIYTIIASDWDKDADTGNTACP